MRHVEENSAGALEMAEWQPSDGIESLPPLTRAVHAVVMRKLMEGNQQSLQLVSIATNYTSEGDYFDIVFTFVMPGGLRVEIECFDALTRQTDHDSQANDVEWASELVEAATSHLAANNLKDIENKVHDDRMKIRRELERWRLAHGTFSYLTDSGIRFTDSRFSALCHHCFTLCMPDEPTRSVTFALGALAEGQNRALVTWTRLLRPDGVTIALDSQASDLRGQQRLCQGRAMPSRSDGCVAVAEAASRPNVDWGHRIASGHEIADGS